MSDILKQLGIKFINKVDIINSIDKYAIGETRISQFLSGMPLVDDVENLITVIDGCINGIPPDTAAYSIFFISCDIDLTGIKIWDDKDYRSGPHESYTLQEFKSVLLLWKEFLQKPPLYGSKVK